MHVVVALYQSATVTHSRGGGGVGLGLREGWSRLGLREVGVG